MDTTDTRYEYTARERGKLYRYSFARITVIAMTALLFAGLLVSLANDMYAFIKPEGEIVLEAEAGTPLPDLSQTLSEMGVILNPTVFSLYVDSKGKRATLEEFEGTLILNSEMSYREIIEAFEYD